MKLESQVCSLELAKRLKELGVKQESYFYSDAYGIHDHNPDPLHDTLKKNCISRFTVAEVGEMLPANQIWRIVKEKQRWLYIGVDDIERFEIEADARAKCLIYLIENGLVKKP